MKTFREVAEQGLPLSSFPPQITDFISSFAESSGAPNSFVAAGVLACAAGICDNYSLEVKYGYIEKPNLYLAVVGYPGVSKSPPIKAALKPLFELDKLKHERFKKKYTAYKKAIESDPKSKIKPPSREPSKLITDGTTEGLITHLSAFYEDKRTPHSVYMRDELKGHFGGMDKYRGGGSGDDYELWLTLYSGGTVSRVLKNETIFVPDARCTVIGGIQPEVYIKHMEDKGDGMIDRFMVAYCEEEPKQTSIFSYVKTEVIDEYNDFMTDIFEQIPEKYKPWDLDKGERKEVLDAIEAFHVWSHRLGEKYDCGAFKKWEQNFYRLIIIIGALWHKKQIDVDMVSKAADLACFFAIDWIKSRIISDSDSQEKCDTRLFAMLKKARTVGKTPREFQNGSKLFRGKENKKALTEAIERAINAGKVMRGEQGRVFLKEFCNV